MSAIVDALRSGRVLLMDGAMGTELMRRGVPEGTCLDACNLERPELVTDIHRAYRDAGAQVLLTNTFQSNSTALEKIGLANQCSEIIAAGVRLARAAAPDCLVLGSVGPFPHDHTDSASLAQCFAGVDGILLETWSDPVAFAVAAAFMRTVPIPILVSFTYRTAEDGTLRTWSGHTPAEIAEMARESGLAALGVNCGKEQELADVAQVLRAYQAVGVPLFARPNAGTPQRRQDGWSYPRTPADMAQDLPTLVDAGAVMAGGCCGTTPEHIRAFRAVVG